MDERVKLSNNLQGGTEIRVKLATITEMGPCWLTDELITRGLLPHDLGQLITRGSTLIIPIRKEEQ